MIYTWPRDPITGEYFGYTFVRIETTVMEALPRDRNAAVRCLLLSYFMFRCATRKNNPDGRWVCSYSGIQADLPLTLEQVKGGLKWLIANGWLISAGVKPPNRQAYWISHKTEMLRPENIRNKALQQRERKLSLVAYTALKGNNEQATTGSSPAAPSPEARPNFRRGVGMQKFIGAVPPINS